MRSTWFSYYYSREISIESQYLYQRAQECVQEGRDAEAVRYFQQAVILSPRYSKAFYDMGHCLFKLGQFDRAAEVFQRAGKLDPRIHDDVTRILDVINNRANSGPGTTAC